MRKELIISIAVIAVLGVIVWQLVKGFFKGEGIFSGLRPDRDEVDITVNKPLDGTKTANITGQEAETIAEIQHVAMHGFGTDEDVMFESLEGLNGKALQLVVDKFGRRRYDGISGGSTFIGKLLNLFQWYTEELTEEENNKMRDIFQKAGFTW